MNLDSVLPILATSALLIFIVLLALIATHGKLGKEDAFTDLLKKVSFAELGMAFGVGAGVFIYVILSDVGFGLIGSSLGIIIGATIGFLFGKVLDAQKARKSLKKA